MEQKKVQIIGLADHLLYGTEYVDLAKSILNIINYQGWTIPMLAGKIQYDHFFEPTKRDHDRIYSRIEGILYSWKQQNLVTIHVCEFGNYYWVLNDKGRKLFNYEKPIPIPQGNFNKKK